MFSVNAKTRRLRLHCDLTIFQVGQLWPALKEALERDDVDEVDLAEVGEFDSAGMQLLLMIKQVAAARKRMLQLVNHSTAVTEVLSLVEAAGLLGDPVIMPSSNRSAGL